MAIMANPVFKFMNNLNQPVVNPIPTGSIPPPQNNMGATLARTANAIGTQPANVQKQLTINKQAIGNQL